MKYIKGLYLILFFTFLYIAIYIIHSKFFNVNVVFYSSILDGLFALFLTLVITNTRFFNIFSFFEKSLFFIILLLFGYSISISIPTVIDRSLSFYILEKLDQRGGSIKLSSFDGIIKNEYMKEHRLVDVRITEQYESGTISIYNDCVQITDRGKLLVKISLFIRNNLLPKKRLLMGEYSDDLTNPFRQDEYEEEGYKCD
jgi:hypothetical protein